MKKSRQILLTILVGLTLLLCGVIIWILLFRQDVVPKFNAPQKGDKGDSVTIDQITEAVTRYLINNPAPQGAKGDPPSTAEIALAVALYLQQNPPVNGEDGANGTDGKAGSSCSTQNVEGGAIITCTDGTSSFIANGTNGADGRTPMLRCNSNKNRWEIRYSEDENWVVIKDQNGNNSKCKPEVI